ncbi:unnamed protein product [Symbiodinium natans]|uniref:Calmodulin n=1 Tax=Symbiodinium natans TaxID=878477 RepID=A0A812V668_9DINO|nr:unnamed protein product [Symbiodinium natans]
MVAKRLHVHCDCLLQALELAGFTILREAWLAEVMEQITRFNTLDVDEFMQMLQMYEERHYAEFVTVFEHFDDDSSGTLEAHELANLLEQCGITALDQVLKEIMVEVAPVDPGSITMDEFKRVIEIIHVNEGFSSREIIKLKEVFRKFDLDRGGTMDTSELHKAMAWLGYGLTKEEVQLISDSCDVGGKGMLEECEFFGFMRKVKEKEIAMVKRELKKQRPIGGAVYMQKQLDRVLRALGYIPNAQAIRDAAEDAAIIRPNLAEGIDVHGQGNHPWKPAVAGVCKTLSGSRRTSVGSTAVRRLSALSAISGAGRRDSSNHSANHSRASSTFMPAVSPYDFQVVMPKTITISNFFLFLEVYRYREGLDRKQIMELDAAFNKYDRRGYGEIDVKDVGKVLRWMGYSASFDVQQMLIKEVDIDESDTLDAVEMRKLVRKFQEKELTSWTTAFSQSLQKGCTCLEVPACVRTLRSLGIKATDAEVEEIRAAIAASFPSNKKRRFSSIMAPAEGTGSVKLGAPVSMLLSRPSKDRLSVTSGIRSRCSSSSSFAAISTSSSSEDDHDESSDEGGIEDYTGKSIDLAVFHLICAKMVADAKLAVRANAGYTMEEVAVMREKFARYDADGSGDIDNHELGKLFQDLCPDMASNMAKRAEVARILAEVDPDKTGSLDFPDFLRLMRQVDDMQDRLRMAKEAFAVEKTKFSSREVEDFRRIFLGEESEDGSMRGILRLDEFLEMLGPVVGLGKSNADELTCLFFDIDSHMHADFREKVVAPLSPKNQRYESMPVNKPRIAVDFPEFLILMHMLLQKNTCRVKEHSKYIAELGHRHSIPQVHVRRPSYRLH